MRERLLRGPPLTSAWCQWTSSPKAHRSRPLETGVRRQHCHTCCDPLSCRLAALRRLAAGCEPLGGRHRPAFAATLLMALEDAVAELDYV